jgi:hypothetical protein
MYEATRIDGKVRIFVNSGVIVLKYCLGFFLSFSITVMRQFLIATHCIQCRRWHAAGCSSLLIVVMPWSSLNSGEQGMYWTLLKLLSFTCAKLAWSASSIQIEFASLPLHALYSFSQFLNQVLAEKILDYRLDTTAGNNPYFSPEIAEAIHQLWKDPIIPKIMDEHSSDFYLMDSAG